MAYPVDDKIFVRKIKIIIDDNTYVWQMGEEIPERVEGNFTCPSTIKSFLSFSPGDEISLKNLERKVKAAEIRLMESGFFYTASVDIVPPLKYPESRTVIIKVKEGFFWRFGGGKIYGVFGKDNLGGKNKSFRVYAGYSCNGLYLRDDSFLGSNFLLGSGIFYENNGPGASDNRMYHSVFVSLFTGYRFLPDWVLGLDTKAQYFNFSRRDGNNAFWDFILNPQLRGLVYLGNPSNPVCIRPVLEGYFYFPIVKNSRCNISFQGSLGINLPFLRRNSLNLQFSTGWSFTGLPDRYFFDLRNTPDRSIRSGYPEDDLLCERYILLNLEYRLKIAGFFIRPIFNTEIEIFIFTDLGWAADYPHTPDKSEFKDAYGFGLRLIFDSPVFSYFSFSYGWNREGKGRFVFTSTKGF
jgi:hypothetical protein